MSLERSEKPGRNDPCPCGANRKYKKCCQRVEDERQGGPQQYAHLSVRQIILKEIESFKEIFCVKLKDDQVEIRETVTDSDVILFVERVNNLWDSKPDLISSMPTKADLKFRALYFGDADILSTVNLLARYSLYCDQIRIIDPLAVFHGMNRAYEHSPYVEPQAWVRQIIRDGVYLASLEGWIRNDLVFATAFPLSLYHPQRKKNRQEIKERLAAKSEEDWDELVRAPLKRSTICDLRLPNF